MKSVVVLLLAAGCGRFGFDEAASGDGAAITYPEAILASEPFAYFRLDENVAVADLTPAHDSSGNAHDGTFRTYLGGMATLGVDGALDAPNVPDAAVHFTGHANEGDGSEGYVDLPDPDEDAAWGQLWTETFTIELFIQLVEPPTTNTYGLVVCEDYFSPKEGGPAGSGFRTGIDGDNTVRFWNDEASGDTLIIGPALNPGDWYHVVVVRHQASVSFYFNGADVTPMDNALLDYTPPNAVMMTECGFGSFHGMPTRAVYDEVAFYPRELTASEIAAHYAASGR